MGLLLAIPILPGHTRKRHVRITNRCTHECKLALTSMQIRQDQPEIWIIKCPCFEWSDIMKKLSILLIMAPVVVIAGALIYFDITEYRHPAKIKILDKAEKRENKIDLSASFGSGKLEEVCHVPSYTTPRDAVMFADRRDLLPLMVDNTARYDQPVSYPASGLLFIINEDGHKRLEYFEIAQSELCCITLNPSACIPGDRAKLERVIESIRSYNIDFGPTEY